MKLTYGSLFSGVGGFDLGFDQAGYDCVFQVEWDKHCQQILARHWPDVPRWSDVQDVNGAELPPCDVLTFGSPCQDLSVAGKRAGLDGNKSSMFFEATRIIKEMRNATGNLYPRIAVWENVPGALSSNKGADFKTVLDEMGDCGALEQEWAVLDAQHFGVPQRRRRIFLVAVFDPAIAGRCASQILPVSEGKRRDHSKSNKERQNTAASLASSIGSDHQKAFVKVVRSGARDAQGNLPAEVWAERETAPTLNAMDNTGETRATVIFTQNQREEIRDLHGVAGCLQAEAGMHLTNYIAQPVIFTAQRVGEAPRIYTDTAPSLLSRMGTGGNNTPMIFNPGAYPIQGTIIGRSDTAGPRGTGVGELDAPMYTLDTVSMHGVGQPIPIQDAREIDKQQNGLGVGEPGDPMYTLDTTGGQAVGQPPIGFSHTQNMDPQPSAEVFPTLRVGGGGHAVMESYTVRRLTPIECERLMGWPDDHTRWKADGTEQADSHRYKQCGNGVATPVARWIAEQIRRII